MCTRLFLAFALLLLSGPLAAVGQEGGDSLNTYSYLQSHFQNPPVEYQSAPLWAWNDRMTRKKIDRQLRDFHDEGIGGVFIHPRPGLITEYLSERWFALVEYAKREAADLGMQVWMYDENSFPSGFGGGHVPAEMPESYEAGQGLQMDTVQQLPPDGEYALAVRREGDRFTTVEAPGEAGDGPFFVFTRGRYHESGRFGGFSYVDLLREGVTEKFVEVTMEEGYEQNFSSDFGHQMPGIFTDEPNIKPPSVDGSQHVIRYTPSLFEKFEDRWGYDLRPHLVSLFKPVGDWRRVRHNYYQLLLDLFIERWAKPWYEYTEAHDLVWTGHYWEHGWPNPTHGGDNMAMYAWHQMPGIDMLFNAPDLRPDQFGNVRAVKELSSAANQLGRRRRLSETYGGGGWELRFEDMKRLGDWEYTLGVNFLNQHLSYSTLKGARKRDFPQSFSYHAPWWEHYEPLADYFSRLSLALSTGRQINHTLILEPTTSAWMYYAPGQSSTRNQSRLESIEHSFHSFLDSLEARQLEYDLGSERILVDHGTVDSDRFVVGERAYDLVVLPPTVETVNATTLSLLENYVQNGGEVISLGDRPDRVNGAASDRLRELAEAHPAAWTHLESPHSPQLYSALATEDFRAVRPTEWGGRVFHQRRILDEGQLLFWSNWSLDESASGRFRISGEAVEQFDLMSGTRSPYPVEKQEGELSVPVELAPGGSRLLFVHDDSASVPTETLQAPPVMTRTEEETPVPPVGTTEIRRERPNMLTLDYLDYTMGGQTMEGIHSTAAADSIFRRSGVPRRGLRRHNPWKWGVQYKKNVLALDSLFGPSSGFEATYTFDVQSSLQDRSSLRAVVEWAQLYEVRINGQVVEPTPNAWAVDRSFDVLDIGEHVSTGTNRLTLEARPMSIHAEVEPVYIMGDFSLASQSHGFEMEAPTELDYGAWTEQGLPLYPYGVSYRRAFEVVSDPSSARYTVRLPEWTGTVAAVWVNGTKAGVIGWKPYELDVTEHLRKGRNEVEVVVYGSLKNLLGPHHYGRSGFVHPGSFAGPSTQPPGADYKTIGYGLFEPFRLMRQNGRSSR